MSEESFESLLEELARNYGVYDGYWDIHGQYHATTIDARQRILTGMGVPADNRQAVITSLREYRSLQQNKFCEVVYVLRESNDSILIPLKPSFAELGLCDWVLTLESGETFNGTVEADILERLSDGELGFEIPQSLPCGYHSLAISASDFQADIAIIGVPETCYLPKEYYDGQTFWGVSAQLYSLRSSSNWGVGDFSDLKDLLSLAAEKGASCVGLNPLHAVSTLHNGTISPYSPNSRLAFHFLYLDVEAVAAFLGLDFDEFGQKESLVELVRDFKNAELIPHQRIAELKTSKLEALYTEFTSGSGDKKNEAIELFEKFIVESDASLHGVCTYQALVEHFTKLDPQSWGWPVWPEEYRDCQSEVVSEFRDQHAERIRFYLFLQWQVELQLAEVVDHAGAKGLSIGLYLDLALGTASGGAETWLNRKLFATGVSMGAPPDALAPQGQNWGLPPAIPHQLKQERYQSWIAALQKNMKYAGAIRIDHAMSLMRLFWSASSEQEQTGAYVEYPLEDLMGILALESQRNRCLVIGEDLGTVPEEVREAMGRWGVLSYKVLIFMKDAEGFIASEHYPRDSLVIASTHDLPTLTAYYLGSDLAVRESLQLHNEEVQNQISSEREIDRLQLFELLRREELVDDRGFQLFKEGGEEGLQIFLHAAQKFLARTPSALRILQLEDLVGQKEQVNLPGTVNEHPNWQRRLELTAEEILNQAAIQELLGS